MGKRTAYSLMDTDAAGNTFIRWEIQNVDDATGAMLSKTYHRTSVVPGGDVEKQIEAVGRHLKSMGFPEPAKAKDRDEVAAHVAQERGLRLARRIA